MLDIGVVGKVGIEVDISCEEVIKVGGGDLKEILVVLIREKVNFFVVKGCIGFINSGIVKDEVYVVLGLGGM